MVAALLVPLVGRFSGRLARGLTVAAPAVAEDLWKSFESKKGQFSVEVPGEPILTTTKRKSFVGTITNHIFTVLDEENADPLTRGLWQPRLLAALQQQPPQPHIQLALLLAVLTVALETVLLENGPDVLFEQHRPGPQLKGDGKQKNGGVKSHYVHSIDPT